MKPLIGITPEAINLKPRWDGNGSFCGVTYSQAIELAGGLPLILPLTQDTGQLDDYLKLCHGFMLSGGGDVCESGKTYGRELSETERQTISGVDAMRDAMEIYLVQQVRRQDRPLLGICRGIQVMNVALGGTLLPDIPGHRNPKPDALAHKLDWTEDGLLRRVLQGTGSVNTSHHQALDRVAAGLTVVARAPDGIIEAVELPGARFFCAVQFHPERLVRVAPEFQRLFAALVDAGRAAGSGRRSVHLE